MRERVYWAFLAAAIAGLSVALAFWPAGGHP
jgi:hypothetical protein